VPLLVFLLQRFLTLVPNSSKTVANNLGVASTSWPLLSSQSHCGHINPAAFLLEEQTERINGSHWVVPAIVAAASSKASRGAIVAAAAAAKLQSFCWGTNIFAFSLFCGI
jgi:hypothetical protein